jgi:hypothetical protein
MSSPTGSSSSRIFPKLKRPPLPWLPRRHCRYRQQLLFPPTAATNILWLRCCAIRQFWVEVPVELVGTTLQLRLRLRESRPSTIAREAHHFAPLLPSRYESFQIDGVVSIVTYRVPHA